MLQDIPVSKKAINITGVNGEYSRVVQLAIEYHKRGWIIKVRKIRGHLYLYARKYVREKRERVWKYLASITEREIEELRRLGILSSTVEELEKYVEEGWRVRVREIGGRLYVSVRKSINGKRIEKGIGYISGSELKLIKHLLNNAHCSRFIVPRSDELGTSTGNDSWEPSHTGNNEDLDFIPEWMLKGIVALLLMLKGYFVVGEKQFSLQRIDVYAEKDSEKLVIEVESSKHRYREGLGNSHMYL